ncbi:hypothetical protein SAMN02745165_02954 [Malonomonas rubra DSM 5091]|uniref:Uncharacterized protein n=1 Tax=Malonomonas rubra DSM 5091 TaxID=1122189 RepID=A0A1M6LF12_MALRU|nr:hypothetical protein [Malonomonas rubra]SHJ69738.1 hypothetical protein SAMN02745165_02954 [Malonomonas rubra DSM 5091]
MATNPDHIDHQLAELLQQALTASEEELFQTVLHSDLRIVSAALKNRSCHEDHLLALLKRRDLNEQICDRIYKRHKKSLSHRLLLALVKCNACSDITFRTLLPYLRLFELVDFCFLPGASIDRKVAAERNILQRLPTTPLGNKMTLARRASAPIVAELLKEANPSLTEACLGSPRVKEAAIFQLLNSSRATADIISMIARHSRWKNRPNLQLAILKNSRTPAVWFTLWLPKLSLPVLKQLAAGQRLNPQQKQLVKKELKKRGGH